MLAHGLDRMDESEGVPHGYFLYFKVSYRNIEDGEVTRNSTWLHVLMPAFTLDDELLL